MVVEVDLLRLESPVTPLAGDIEKDLELDRVLSVASRGDKLVEETWREVILQSKVSLGAARYRLEAVADALSNKDLVLQLYNLAGDVVREADKKVWLVRTDNPVFVVHEAAAGLKIMVRGLERLLGLLRGASFTSKAFRGLVGTVEENVDEEFLAEAGRLAETLQFREGLEFTARLGEHNTLRDPVLRPPRRRRPAVFSRILGGGNEYRFALDPRDEAGTRVLHEIRAWVLSRIAGSVMNAYERLRGFFLKLRKHLSFYVGAINYAGFLAGAGLPMALPEFRDGVIRLRNLYCLSLAVSSGRKPVPYVVDEKGKNVVLVSGANRGGKTTFLKAVGQAQLLARAGLPVPAEALVSPSTGAVYTHFLREEERSLSYGKFEEEVRRFSILVRHARRGDFVLMDESFSSTNQVEASMVAENVVAGLSSAGVYVFYVTYLQDFLYRFPKRYPERTVILVAERLPDGTRTYRLTRGELQPGYAIDVWRRVFGSKL